MNRIITIEAVNPVYYITGAEHINAVAKWLSLTASSLHDFDLRSHDAELSTWAQLIIYNDQLNTLYLLKYGVHDYYEL